MTFSISLSPSAEATLRQRAAAVGQDPAVYAAQLLEELLSKPSIEDLLAPLRRQFACSGTTDEMLVEQITNARAAYRR